jgi:hypothetical protein
MQTKVGYSYSTNIFREHFIYNCGHRLQNVAFFVTFIGKQEPLTTSFKIYVGVFELLFFIIGYY